MCVQRIKEYNNGLFSPLKFYVIFCHCINKRVIILLLFLLFKVESALSNGMYLKKNYL